MYVTTSHNRLRLVRPIWLIIIGQVRRCQEKVCVKDHFWKISGKRKFQMFLDLHTFGKKNYLLDRKMPGLNE